MAWQPLGWEAHAFSEIERFPNSVLAHHYPNVPNWGDMEKFNEWPRSNVDVLVGGTPCQSFSIAGLRGGLADPRGNLALAFLGVVERFQPRWVAWENVPGVFSSLSHEPPDLCRPPDPVDMGLDGQTVETSGDYSAIENHGFACFLAGLSELGYGWAYRVLDAQHFGIPQRRRRVFVVGHIAGDWHGPAAVLFERHSLFRNPPPSRKTGEETAGTSGASTKSSGRATQLDGHGAYIPEVSYALETTCGDYSRADGFNMIAEPVTSRPYADRGSDGNVVTEDIAAPLTSGSSKDSNRPGRRREDDFNIVAEAYQCHGDNVGPMGTLRGGHNEISGVPFTFDETQITSAENRSNPQPGDPANTIPSNGRPPSLVDSRVRRLTPLECERLMGFPDLYTDIPGASDSARYRALGNSIAVPVLRWIGERLATVDEILKRKA